LFPIVYYLYVTINPKNYNMNKLISAVGILLIAYTTCYAQEEPVNSKVNIGLGIGFDYGGFGGRLSFLPAKNVALFGALGYNFMGAGYNVGATVRLAPDKRVCPTLSAMYGYNAVLKVSGASKYDVTSYGPSFGLGLELKSKRNPKTFWHVELLLPVRSKKFKDKYDAAKNDPSIEFKSDIIPVGFSFGYHFML
jgi:hypothetical protein